MVFYMSSSNTLFKWDGDDYSKKSKSQKYRARASLKGKLKKGIKVLDVGCGDGDNTVFMADEVSPGKVIGLDKDISMLKKASFLRRKNLSFVHADAIDFKLSEKFDLITSFFCLQWIPEDFLEKTFKNFHAHLNDEGKIHILLPCYDFPHEIIKGVANSPKWKTYFQNYREPQTFLNESAYQKILDHTHFGGSVERVLSKHPTDIEDFIGFTRQWCGCYFVLKDQKLQEDFINDIREKLREINHGREEFVMHQESIHIIAKRLAPHLSHTHKTEEKNENSQRVIKNKL